MPKPQTGAINPRGQRVYVPTFRTIPRSDSGEEPLLLEAAGSSYSGPLQKDESHVPAYEKPLIIADIERWIRICQRSSTAPESPGSSESWRCEMQGKLLALADHKGGFGTSYSILRELLQYIARSMPWIAAARNSERLLEEMRHMMARCEHSVRQRLESGAAGSSLAVAYVTWPDVYLASMGGSRAYLVRDDQMHLVADDCAEARENPPRGAGIVVSTFPMRQRDWLLLCSDGLLHALGYSSICQIVGEALSPDQASERLIAAARTRSDRHPLTALVCRPHVEYRRGLGGRN